MTAMPGVKAKAMPDSAKRENSPYLDSTINESAFAIDFGAISRPKSLIDLENPGLNPESSRAIKTMNEPAKHRPGEIEISLRVAESGPKASTPPRVRGYSGSQPKWRSTALAVSVRYLALDRSRKEIL